MVSDDEGKNGLPTAVRDFLVHSIQSVGELELLLLLHTYPQKRWSADEVSHQLRTNPSWAQKQLFDLEGRGLLKRDENGTFYFEPNSPELAETIHTLSSWYATHRITFINAIYSKPMDNVRVFADAFRIKKDPKK